MPAELAVALMVILTTTELKNPTGLLQNGGGNSSGQVVVGGRLAGVEYDQPDGGSAPDPHGSDHQHRHIAYGGGSVPVSFSKDEEKCPLAKHQNLARYNRWDVRWEKMNVSRSGDRCFDKNK
jgi:hypothetical protein